MMKKDVTVVVEDRLIIVNGDALEIPGGIVRAPGHEGLRALQWHGTSGELEFEGRERPLGFDDYKDSVKPYVDQHANRSAELLAEWSRPENVKARRIEAIGAELDELDAKSVRHIRASLAGTATEADKAALAEIERQAENLRAELRGLTEGDD